jgi:hypothetical protein
MASAGMSVEVSIGRVSGEGTGWTFYQRLSLKEKGEQGGCGLTGHGWLLHWAGL